MQAEKWRKRHFCLQVGQPFNLSANENICVKTNVSSPMDRLTPDSPRKWTGWTAVKPCFIENLKLFLLFEYSGFSMRVRTCEKIREGREDAYLGFL